VPARSARVQPIGDRMHVVLPAAARLLAGARRLWTGCAASPAFPPPACAGAGALILLNTHAGART
jgi:hypothetical protein